MTRQTVTDPRVRAAFDACPRRRFLPAAQRDHAEHDAPLPLGHGQTSSQPSTVAAMLDLLEMPTGARVLDVGAGSGWTTALLAHLVGPTGRVLGLELEPDLAGGASRALGTGTPWARVRVADPGTLGAPGDAPFDRVLVSAMAEELPAALVAQLAVGGVMVVPVAGTMLRVRRTGEGTEVTEHGAYRFVPLR